VEDTLKTNARAVLDVLRASPNHPTAMEVYEAVRRSRPRIGLATVYRILHQLTGQGLIKELEYGSGCSRYDARTCRHDHAICIECKALLDIPQDIQFSNEALQAAAQSAGFELGSHEVRIYGHCRACQTRRNE
jgi:Fur family peroxide stress response transcriptional regulator